MCIRDRAIGEAAVRGGIRFFAGYPITPQSELPEYLSWRLPEVGGCFVQGESCLLYTSLTSRKDSAGQAGTASICPSPVGSIFSTSSILSLIHI